MSAPTPAPNPPRPRPTLTARIVAGVVGTFAALTLGELVATAALHDAYPSLNLYEPDPSYGVRLTPDATTRVASPRDAITDYRTNALGFRGPEWPAPGATAPVRGRVLVVGDSQVMGWGVAEDDTFSADLQRALGGEVLAAGVPTWGPGEYARAVAELVPAYRPTVVLFVMNAANDWDEAPIPNARRTTARDGWARLATGPRDQDFVDFPGRRWLLGRSHLWLALRLLVDPPPSSALAPALATRFVDDLPRLASADGTNRSRLTRHVLAARATCERYGCRFIPVVMPMDIQVDRVEWAKYRTSPRDTTATLALAAALHDDLADLAPPVDLRPALVAASPGAFLPDDYHLSAKGHAAVAAALATHLGATTPGSSRVADRPAPYLEDTRR